MGWSGGIAEWIEGDTAHISVVFSWNLQAAFQKIIWYKTQGYKVKAGGPAVLVQPHFLNNIADIGLEYSDAVSKHNPDATFTSKGCIRNCDFCIVPKAEGGLIEFNDFPIRSIICDNNFLACSNAHFERVIDKLKPLKGIDFNQGLDARLMTKHKAERLAELDLSVVRMAWDHVGIEKQYLNAFQILLDAGFKAKDIRSYVLIGHNDTPEDALYRLQTIKDLGAYPNPMRYQPLTSTKRNGYVGKNWTKRELKDYMRYWSRQMWLEHIPFEDYKPRARYKEWDEVGK